MKDASPVVEPAHTPPRSAPKGWSSVVGRPLTPATASTRMCIDDAIAGARIVLIDDDPVVLEILSLHLEEAGYRDIVTLTDSTRALASLRAAPPDVVLTDLKMPGVDGFELLEQVRKDPQLARLPVIMLTSSSSANTRLAALELGATDFLAKPVDPSELSLRLRNNLVAKTYQDQLNEARRESENLLLSILPRPVAERLKRGETVADDYDNVTVLFADLVDFTRFSAEVDAATVVAYLNEVFHAFDQIVDKQGLDKIKTIGDAYMLAGGLMNRHTNHAARVVDAGLAMISVCADLANTGQVPFRVRIGVHSGPVVAGVIGTRRMAYDIWGDTVNVASRLESTGIVDHVQVSDATRQRLGAQFTLEARGPVEIKGKGTMDTWIVTGRQDGAGD